MRETTRGGGAVPVLNFFRKKIPIRPTLRYFMGVGGGAVKKNHPVVFGQRHIAKFQKALGAT